MKWNEELLDEVLPHGSGIDAEWRYDAADYPQFITASCEFHAMDEYGGYVGWVPFHVTIPVDMTYVREVDVELDVDKDEVEMLEKCGVYADLLLDYLNDTIYFALYDYTVSVGGAICV